MSCTSPVPSALALERVLDAEAGGAALRVGPGGIVAVREPIPLVSLLGSCVAVCLHDPAARVGGMNHIVFARGRGPDPKFGRTALTGLLGALKSLGAVPGRLQAKVTGGGRVLASMDDIGSDNVDFVTEALEALRLPVLAWDVRGDQGRKIIFEPWTGRLRVRRYDPRPKPPKESS